MADIHPRAPWKDVTFAGGFWNCADRLDALLGYVRPWFRNIVVVVQKAQSPDDRTLEVARKWADVVLEDEWHGRGDPSISLAVRNVKTKYAFVVADDEWPSPELLNSFQELVTDLRAKNLNGSWIKFESWIEGYDFTRNDQHLRFFETSVGWPSGPHARPATEKTFLWETGSIKHDRTLDEMMIDYVRRYEMGKTQKGWADSVQPHNQRMMLTATRAIAERKGWDYVKSFDWWPKVCEFSWGGVEQFDPPVEEKPVVVEEPPASRRTKRKRR